MPYIGAGLTRFNTADELTVTGTSEFKGNASFGDNDKILIGDGSDLQISHDGSGSLILDSGTGNLVIAADELILRNAGNNEAKADFTTDGAVNLYFDNAAKLATKSDGVDITGELQADSLDIDGNGTIDGSLTITTVDNSANLTLTSTDADASAGPILELYRNSASPADDDVVGEIQFHAENDADEKIEYAIIAAKLQDVSDGTEDVRLSLKTKTAGTERERITIQPSETVVNEDSQDLDFRVESNGNANMLVVDGGNNSVGIGLAAGSQESGAFLHSGGQCLFQHNHTDTSSSGNVSYLAGNQALTLVNAQAGAVNQTCKLGFTVTTTGANTDGLIEYGSTAAGSGEFRFYTEQSNTIGERLRIRSDGRIGVNNTNPLAKLQVTGEGQGTDTGTTVKVGTDNTGFGGNASVMGIHCGRAGNSAYRFLQMNSDHDAAHASTSDAEFIFYGNGNANADGSFTGGGADYAEYFEWDDGNSSDEDRRGYSVVLVNNKVRKATSSDATSDIIGVVSGRPAVVGDGDIDRWKGKYMRDDYGAYIMETYTITRWTEERDDEEDIEHIYPSDRIPSDLTVPSDATVDTQDSAGITFTRRRLNPDYDDTQTYTPRSERQEWDTIGLMGKLRLRAGQPTGDRWIKMRDIATDDDGNVTVEEWLVR
mgnify:FL=1